MISHLMSVISELNKRITYLLTNPLWHISCLSIVSSGGINRTSWPGNDIATSYSDY